MIGMRNTSPSGGCLPQVLALATVLLALLGSADPAQHRLASAVLQSDHREVIAALLDGADLEQRNEAGLRPLQQAVRQNSTFIVYRLVKAGADLSATVPSGASAPPGAVPGDTALLLAVRGGNHRLVKDLLELRPQAHWPDLEMANEDGTTPLLEAVLGRNEQIVNLLVDSGVSLDKRCGRKNTSVLMHTVLSEDLEMARLLLRGGAEPNVFYDGLSALDLAQAEGPTEMAKLLALYGASRSHGSMTKMLVACGLVLPFFLLAPQVPQRLQPWIFTVAMICLATGTAVALSRDAFLLPVIDSLVTANLAKAGQTGACIAATAGAVVSVVHGFRRLFQ